MITNRAAPHPYSQLLLDAARCTRYISLLPESDDDQDQERRVRGIPQTVGPTSASVRVRSITMSASKSYNRDVRLEFEDDASYDMWQFGRMEEPRNDWQVRVQGTPQDCPVAQGQGPSNHNQKFCVRFCISSLTRTLFHPLPKLALSCTGEDFAGLSCWRANRIHIRMRFCSMLWPNTAIKTCS